MQEIKHSTLHKGNHFTYFKVNNRNKILERHCEFILKMDFILEIFKLNEMVLYANINN